MVRRKSGTGNERVLSSRVSEPCQDPNPNPWLPNTPLPPPPLVLCHQSRVTRTIFLFVCLFVFFYFQINGKKNPLFNAKHPFSFRSKMSEKTGSALDPAGSTRRSLLFDRDLYLLFTFGFVVLVARGCGFVVDFPKPFAVKSQVWLENKLSLFPCYFVAFTWMQCSTDRGRREHRELRLGSQVTDQNNLHCIELGTSWPMVSSNFIFHIWLESFQQENFNSEAKDVISLTVSLLNFLVVCWRLITGSKDFLLSFSPF